MKSKLVKAYITRPLLFLFSIILLPVSSVAQQDSSELSYTIANDRFDGLKLFEKDDLLEITLKFDISYLRRKKPETEDLEAVLNYISGVDSITDTVKIRARGNFRKNYCDFPPISLNFKKSTTSGDFSGIDRLKMVTYCKKGMDEFIFKEYLIYKLYNILTDQSFRVRLLKINLINTAKKDDKPLTEYGFVIEPVSSLEKRIDSREIENVYLTQKNVDPETMNRMAIFNYMIGNTDWSVPIRHNALMMTQPGSEKPTSAIVVPFDFDFAGLVNTKYAAPFEGIGIETVRERKYLGVCMDDELFLKSLGEFRAHEKDFYTLINDFPYLATRVKKEMLLYLREFYDLLDKKNTILSYLRKDCLTF
jgi:hypothetical protein